MDTEQYENAKNAHVHIKYWQKTQQRRRIKQKNKIKLYSHQVLTAESLGGSLQLEAYRIVQKS